MLSIVYNTFAFLFIFLFSFVLMVRACFFFLCPLSLFSTHHVSYLYSPLIMSPIFIPPVPSNRYFLMRQFKKKVSKQSILLLNPKVVFNKISILRMAAQSHSINIARQVPIFSLRVVSPVFVCLFHVS